MGLEEVCDIAPAGFAAPVPLSMRTCKCMDLVLAAGLAVHVSNKAGEATDAVAAHLWLAAVAVEDAHREVG